MSDETGGENDLVVRRAWIPYFNIQYYLGPRRDQPQPGRS